MYSFLKVRNQYILNVKKDDVRILCSKVTSPSHPSSPVRVHNIQDIRLLGSLSIFIIIAAVCYIHAMICVNKGVNLPSYF